MQRYAVTCLKLTSTGGDCTKLGALALSLLYSANVVSECLIYPYKIPRRESSKCNDLVVKQCESCSGMLAVFFCDISVSHSALGAQRGLLVRLPYEVHQG